MRVLHVIDSVDPRMGGTARAPLDICAGLVDRGDDVLLVSTVSSGDDLTAVATEYERVPLRLFRRRFPRHNFRAPSLRRWLRANVADFDLVEIHGVFSFVPIYAAWACHRSSVPYTVRPHGSLDPFDLRKHALAKRVLAPVLFRPMLQRAVAVLLTSQIEADRLVTFGAEPRREVAPLPVQRPLHSGDGQTFRTARGIPPDAVVVLLLGRIHPKKGLQFLIPALASLKGLFPDLWFLLVGTGEKQHLDEVNRLLNDHAMASWTTWCDFLTGQPKQSAFAASNIFALPSLNENFGIAVVEAMYAGLPVLISTEVYIHDVVTDGGAGVACEPNVASCRSALQNLLRDQDARRRMGRDAPEVAQRHFAPHAAIGALEQIQRSLLGRPNLAPEQS
jgi:glycosyltransferase involved in cell wall biosynthesis